ncbi:MAG: XrtA/PEP-CTERM system TPR-repeat protein PrsT [Burkholderiales bacterium]
MQPTQNILRGLLIRDIARSLLLAVSLALPMLGGLMGCDRTPSIEKLSQDAQRLQDKGEFKAAVIQLKNAVQNDPNNADIRFRLGVLHNKLGDGASAEKELKKALELSPNYSQASAELASSLLRQGAFDRILSEVKVPAPGSANLADILVVRAQAHAALRQTKEAEADFVAALAARPEFPDALVGQARMKAAIDQDVSAALVLIERALNKDPKNRDALLAKGDFKRFQGHVDEATSAYTAAVDANPQSLAARLSRAAILLAAGKNKEAQTDIDVAFKTQPGNLIATYLQALTHFRNGKNEAARDSLQNVLKVIPNHVPSLLLSGAVYSALGSNQQAETNLRKVLDAAPDNLLARRLLTGLLLRTRQPKKAIEIIAPALKNWGDDPQILALAGDAYMQSGDFDKATQYLEKATTIDPKSAHIRAGLGLTRLAAGEGNAAIVDLEKAVSMDSNQYQADILLAMSYLNRREFDPALKALDSLEKKQPDNPLTYNFKGAAYVGKKDLVNARKNFERAVELNPTYFPATANLAQLDLQEKNPDAAKKRFEAVLAKDKTSVQAMLALASLAMVNKQSKEALDWIHRARAANPKSVQPSLALVRYYAQLGDAKQAVAAAQDAQNQSPDNPELLDLLGMAQLSAEQNEEAISTFSKLSKIQPDSPLAHYRSAQAEIAAKDTRAAESSLVKALNLKPDFLDAQVALAGLRVQAKRFDEALPIAKDAIKLAPKSPAGHMLAGDIYLAQDKPADAAIAYQNAYDLAKSGGILIKLHHAQELSGKAAPMSVIENHLKDNPKDIQVRIYLADLLMKKNLFLEASRHYQTILETDPKNLLALNNIAWSLQQLKDARAVKYAEEAYKLQPSNPAIADTYAMLMLDAGKTTRAVELLEAAASQAADSPDIGFHLAQALHKAGDNEKAKKVLERALALGKRFSEEAEAKALLRQLKS